MNNNRSQNITNYTKLTNATCVDAALKAPILKQQNKALERGRRLPAAAYIQLLSHVDVCHSAQQYVTLAVQIMSATLSFTRAALTAVNFLRAGGVMTSLRMLRIGMYRISVFQIRPEPDLAGFMKTNPAGAGAGAGFQNLVQHKTTPELQ